MRPASDHPKYREAHKRASGLHCISMMKSYQDVEAILAGCYYDKFAAQRVIDFCSRLRFTPKGRWTGDENKFQLVPWQVDIVKDIFGWKRADGSRRYRRAYIEIPKKNGKSTLCSALSLYLFIADKESAAEVYVAAGDRNQAGIVYRAAADMVRKSGLERHVKITDSVKNMRKGESIYRVLSSDAGLQEGLNVSGLIFDELHAQRNNSLWAALADGGIARRQPLTIVITTAGVYDPNHISYVQHEYAKNLIDGIFTDWTYYPCIYGLENTDDWTDKRLWKKANPSWNISIDPDEFETTFQQAQHQKALQADFKRRRLNIWVQNIDSWIRPKDWRQCRETFTADEMTGQDCVGGLDLSSNNDMTSLCLYFPESGRVLHQHWLPHDNLLDLQYKHNAPYLDWERDKHINTTPGNVIDYEYIEAKVLELANRYRIRQLAYDPYNASMLISRLEGQGIPCVKHMGGFAYMNEPVKQIEIDIANKAIKHNGDPVLAWQINNARIITDPHGNVRITKSRRTGKSQTQFKIDAVIAMVLARSMAISAEKSQGAIPGIGVMVV